jgi:hypothetical protein
MGGVRSYRPRKLLSATAGLATLTYFGAGSCTSANLMPPPGDYGVGGTQDGGTGGSTGGRLIIGGGGTPPITGGSPSEGGMGGCEGGAAGEGGQGGSSCG